MKVRQKHLIAGEPILHESTNNIHFLILKEKASSVKQILDRELA